MDHKPIKRHLSLQPISREHHDGLLFCWKIRNGLTKSIETNRIKAFADWFFKNHLLPHFYIEEKFLFPILGNKDDLVKKALSEHRKIKRLFENQSDVLKSISLIEEELEKHIRFEERVLFNKIQENASEGELAFLADLHVKEEKIPEWNDPFWKEFNS